MAGLQLEWLEFSRFTAYKEENIFLFGRIQTGVQSYNATSPYSEVTWCVLFGRSEANSAHSPVFLIDNYLIN